MRAAPVALLRSAGCQPAGLGSLPRPGFRCGLRYAWHGDALDRVARKYTQASVCSSELSAARIMIQFGTAPIARFLRLILFSHTIFALPFALAALIVAASGWPSPRILLLVIVCMVFARTAAMLFNRVVDWSLDQRNPRTASRHLLVPEFSAAVLLILASAGFLLAACAINRLTCILAPVALVLIFFYSVTKRFTSATHFFLGLALAIA